VAVHRVLIHLLAGNAKIIGDEETGHICGYNSKLNKIEIPKKLRSYHRSIQPKITGHWVESVCFKKKLIELLQCSQREVSRILKISPAAVSDELKLATKFEKNPSLKKTYKSKTSAIEAIKSYINPIDYEEDLQKYIYKEWNNIPLLKNWLIYEKNHLYGKYNTIEAGEIDLLAQHQDRNEWLIIELKRNTVSDHAVLQTLRYMGWVQENLAKKNDIIKGMIIGAACKENINLILKWISNIEIYIYERLPDKKIHFLSLEESRSDEFKLIQYLRKMTPQEIEKALKKN